MFFQALALKRKQRIQERVMNKHIGSNFDDFLNAECLQEEVTATAVKRVIVWQIAQVMKHPGSDALPATHATPRSGGFASLCRWL